MTDGAPNMLTNTEIIIWKIHFPGVFLHREMLYILCTRYIWETEFTSYKLITHQRAINALLVKLKLFRINIRCRALKYFPYLILISSEPCKDVLTVYAEYLHKYMQGQFCNPQEINIAVRITFTF